ncbi:unnamed protein product [Trichobilharzia szidati]|nr:unnamed protein product [Trichobilharzia szidati]
MRSDDILTGPEFPSWFNNRGLIAIPYIAAFTLIFLMTIGGSKVFGLLLYILSPLAVCLLTGVLITVGVNYADSTNQLRDYTNKFYRMFFAMIPINPDGVDTYEVQPLVWGFLSTFVHLSQSNNLWNGVYPVLGKLIGGGSKMRHLGWIPLAIGSILLGQLPVLIMLFAVASSYDPQYVRCHLSADWLAPFVIMSHIFSKFSSPRALVTSYFLGLSLCLLLNQALILLTTVEHIVGHLTVINEKYEDHYKRIYRCSIVFTILLLGLLGLPLITQSGFYWIRLIDWFVDRLMIIPVIGQVVGFLTVYAQSKGTKFETPLLKTCVICIYAILFTFSGSIYIWYAFTGLQKPPDSQCRTFSRAPVNDPLQDNFSLLGWLIAFGPVMLGIVTGLLLALIRFRSHQQYTRYSYFRYLFKGEYGLQKFTQITAHSSSQMKYNPPKFSNYPKHLSWTRINHCDDFGSTKLLSPNLHQIHHQSHFAVNQPLYRSVGDGLGIFMPSNDNLSQASSTNRLPLYVEHSRRHRPDNYVPPQHRRSEVNIYNKSAGKTNEHQYYNSRYNRHHNYPNRHSVGRLDIYESEEFL